MKAPRNMGPFEKAGRWEKKKKTKGKGEAKKEEKHWGDTKSMKGFVG